MKTFCHKFLFLITLLIVSVSNSFAQYEWEEWPTNPLNIHGSPGSWDESVVTPCVIFNPDLNRYEMWFGTFDGTYPNNGIGFAWSTDGITWTKHPSAVMTPSGSGWDAVSVGECSVIKEGNVYKMWYTGHPNSTRTPSYIGYANSTDGGITWQKYAGNPVLSPGTGWESARVEFPSVIKVTGGYWMFYTGELAHTIARTGRAFSTDGINWQKDTVNNPVLLPGDPGEWDQNNYLGNVIELNNTLYIYYTANPDVGGTAIGGAVSIDMGITWSKFQNNPIIQQGTTGQWDDGWIETGSAVFAHNQLRLYFDGGSPSTGWLGRIGFATSLVVPVELTSFTATSNGKEVILNWSTATELNNQLFEVQRSFEGSDFATVGFVNGKGTTTERQDYTYSDKILADGKYYYRLKQIDYLGSYEYSDVIEMELRAFNSYLLEQNYPNPFNPTTKIGFGIQNKSNVKITILNAIGEEVALVLNEEREPGYHQVEFNAANLPSGVYLYQLRAGEYTAVKKMLLIK